MDSSFITVLSACFGELTAVIAVALMVGYLGHTWNSRHVLVSAATTTRSSLRL
ncbi:hypothetical protein PV367_15410 [Streptomyces europaeiscabiei]|uniref:Uncharacterized protein n=1 Tax=Streptomyces europaeiscabiei TaxID=146819 RepID=A0AAJ2PPM4_9ACTN|nr:hypothetical protein [Streptomyces europaeiscabiei]MDX3131140.1 hypothetical protein [Streptomyces europaeiscabiei]